MEFPNPKIESYQVEGHKWTRALWPECDMETVTKEERIYWKNNKGKMINNGQMAWPGSDNDIRGKHTIKEKNGNVMLKHVNIVT